MKELHMYRRMLPLVLSPRDLARPVDALCVVAHVIGDVEQHPEWTLTESHLKELRDCLKMAAEKQPYRGWHLLQGDNSCCFTSPCCRCYLGIYYPVDTALHAIRRFALNDESKPLVAHMCLTDIIAVMDPSATPATNMTSEQRTAAVELAVGLIFTGQLNLYQTATLQRVFQSLRETDEVDRIRRQAGIGLFNLASLTASAPATPAPDMPAVEMAVPETAEEPTMAQQRTGSCPVGLGSKQAYLSYPESQTRFARLVHGWLRERDFQVHTTDSHREVKETEALIRQVDCVVLFVCEDYMESPSCKREVRLDEVGWGQAFGDRGCL